MIWLATRGSATSLGRVVTHLIEAHAGTHLSMLEILELLLLRRLLWGLELEVDLVAVAEFGFKFSEGAKATQPSAHHDPLRFARRKADRHDC